MKLSGYASAKYRANRFDIAVCVTGNDVSTIDTRCCDAMRQPADARLRRKTRFYRGFFDDGAGWRRKTLIFPRSWWRCAPDHGWEFGWFMEVTTRYMVLKHWLFDVRARSVSLAPDWKRLRHYFIRYPDAYRASDLTLRFNSLLLSNYLDAFRFLFITFSLHN